MYCYCLERGAFVGTEVSSGPRAETSFLARCGASWNMGLWREIARRFRNSIRNHGGDSAGRHRRENCSIEPLMVLQSSFSGCLQSKAAACALFSFSDRSVQLSTTCIFCRKNGKYSTSTIKYYVRKSKIHGFWETRKQYFIVLYFPFFWQKIQVVLNCTLRSEKEKRAHAAALYNFALETP